MNEMKKGKFSWRFFGENFVFQEGDHYYKMPSFLAKNIMYRKIDSYKKVNDSIALITKYFGPIVKIAETEVLKDKDGYYIIKQKSIKGEKLSKKVLENNPKLLSKFKRLIIANEIMWVKEGAFLDLLGSDTLTSPNLIHNLMTDSENIYVFDFGLLENTGKNIIFRYFSHFARKIQLKLINKYF